MMPPVLIVPGYTDSGPGHWQTLWERRLPTARRVEQRSWTEPDRSEWIAALEEAVASSEMPPVLVAHSLGCLTVAHWAAAGGGSPAAAALLVAPPDVERSDTPHELRGFAPIPLRHLPFPSILVASSDDPYASPERSDAIARAWGSRYVPLAGAGHINTAGGFGRWPAGEALLQELLANAAVG